MPIKGGKCKGVDSSGVGVHRLIDLSINLILSD